MILQSLHSVYERLSNDERYGIAEAGFSPQKISFKIVLHPDGKLHTIEDARIRSDTGRLIPQIGVMPGNAKPAGAGINPCFLWDNQTYLLGVTPQGKDPEFSITRFNAFKARHLEHEQEINTPTFSSVCRFLENWDPKQVQDHPILNEVGTGFGTFQLINQSSFITSQTNIKQWWLNNQPVTSEIESQCLLTGEVTNIARLHPKIKGVFGAQSAGASLVSFNDSAYTSYGKSQSFNSPVGELAAFQYGAALNALLSGPMSKKHRMRIGDTTCVFWTEKPSLLEDVWADFSNGGSSIVDDAEQDEALRKKIQIFLNALRSGKAAETDIADNPSSTRFYLIGLAPNAARLAVRFFYQSTISEMVTNLRLHRSNIELVKTFEKPVGDRAADQDYPAWWEFLRETSRSGDDPSPLLGGALVRSILEGTRYPEAFLSAIVRRIHMERKVNYLKVALIKAILIRNHQLNVSVMLDLENKKPAYLQGRLFAVLEKIQEEGHQEQTGGKLDKTIRETYFSSACSTPASVFPRLEQLSTHHRRHLKPGRKVQFDQLVGDIKWEQDQTPKTFNLEEQGIFILGYYHQRKDLFTSKKESSTATE